MKYFATALSALVLISCFGQEPPSSAEAEFEEAMESYRFQEALRAGEKWLMEDTANLDAAYTVGAAYAKLGYPEMALITLNTALAIDSTHLPTIIQLSKIAQDLGRNKKALSLAENLLARDTGNSYFYRMAAKSAFAVFELNKAVSYYQKAIELDSTNTDSYLALADLYAKMRQSEAAEKLVDKGLEIDSADERLLLFKAGMAFNRKEYQNVLGILAPLFSESANPRLGLRIYGLSLYHSDSFPQAMDVLRRLANSDPSLDYPHYYMALCLTEMNQPERAEIQYRQAVNKALSPNLGVYYRQLGLSQQELNMHAKAIKNLKMAQKFSNDPSILFALAESYDLYYKDKSIALEVYEGYLSKMDSTETTQTQRAKARVSELKKEMHFGE
jgi:tetratricopeptide (TPR) repeat protein